jgi:molybdopterin synthase sulfur carrier subunit
MEITAFGRLADIIKNKEVRLDHITTTDQLRQALQLDFPSLSATGYTIAVNNMIRPGNTTLEPDDKIALLPPYSGG